MAWIELERRVDTQTKTYELYLPEDYDIDGNLLPGSTPYYSETRDEDTVWTLVQFDFGVTCDIPHFMPPDEDYIQLSISNREITEKRKLGIE